MPKLSQGSSIGVLPLPRGLEGYVTARGSDVVSKLCLQVAVLVAALNFLMLKLGDTFRLEKPLLVAVALCLPAAAAGALSWWKVRGFVRSWTVVACVAVAWVGLIYALRIEKNRGLVAVSYLTCTLPVAALIVERRCWWWCAKMYVLAHAFALALALWLEYQAYGEAMYSYVHRLGFLLTDNAGRRLVNPNLLGSQLAFAAVLAFVLYLRDGTQTANAWNPAPRRERFSLGWSVFLSLGCILTASRSAFVAWLAGMGVLLLWGTRNQGSSRLRDLVALVGVLVFVLVFFAVSTGFSPWGTLQTRLDATGEILSASGRLDLWKGGLKTWLSSAKFFVLGAGTGAAPEALGQHCRMLLDDGSPGAMNTHNTFLEWGLSYGLVGILLGANLAVIVLQKARRLDRQEQTVNRQALLLCFGLISLNLVTFYELFFIVAGALILAMVSEEPEQPPARSTP